MLSFFHLSLHGDEHFKDFIVSLCSSRAFSLLSGRSSLHGGELAKGKEKSMGLPSSCSSLPALVKVFAPIGFSELSFSCPAIGASSPVFTNTPFFF